MHSARRSTLLRLAQYNDSFLHYWRPLLRSRLYARLSPSFGDGMRRPVSLTGAVNSRLAHSIRCKKETGYEKEYHCEEEFEKGTGEG